MRVRFVKKVGTFRKGALYDLDSASAATLLEEGVVEPEDVVRFDPSEHTVPQVLAHLDGADGPERHRVLTAERAGKARVGILDG